MVSGILKRVATGIGAATLLVIVVGFFLPGSYTVVRTQVIAADMQTIHALVNDLKRWPEWTPWLDEDPTIEVELGTITSGLGAHQTWHGDSGGGELTFTGSDLQRGITYDMSFDGKYASAGTITYVPGEDGTLVTWVMTGDNGRNPLARFLGLAMNSMVGPMFEDGLAKLKLAAERDQHRELIP